MDLRKLILISFVFSGAAALVYEVAWTRPLQFVLGSTIYTISIIFAAFMAGLALGSWLMSKYVEKIRNLPKAYALMEIGIGLYGLLLLSLFYILPKGYRLLYEMHGSFYMFELGQFILTFIVLLIPTTLMGATWPVVAKYCTKSKIGKGIGEAYSANNLGAIVGSFAAGFILVPLFGIKPSIIIAAIINLLIASSILITVAKDSAKKILPVAILLFLAFAYFGDYDTNELYSGGFGREEFSEDALMGAKFLYHKEGLYATVSVVQGVEGSLMLLFNGKGQGSSIISDLRVNFLLAYLPLLIKEDIKDALVIGLGTGTTSGQLSQFIKTTTVEIEPAVIGTSKYFNFMNLNVLGHPNHELIIADGRNYLLKSKEKYDIIVPEPCDPWQSFSTALYSKEFFEMAKNHLNEGGLYVQWVPIYEMDVESFKSFYNTFGSVFPHTLAFATVKEDEDLPVDYKTAELIFIGSESKIEIDEENFRENFDKLPEIVKENFGVLKLGSADSIFHLSLFSGEDMKDYGKDAQLITDDNPIFEFSTAKRILYRDPKEVTEDIGRFLVKKGENS